MRARFLSVLMASVVSWGIGLPTAAADPVAADDEAAWLIFDIVERGSHLPVVAYVWAEGHREDFEVVAPVGGPPQRFAGLGRTGEGYAVPVVAGATLTLVVWAERHELMWVEVQVAPGENRVPAQLRKTEVADTRVPMEIWLDVLQRMIDVRPPGETLKSGS